jgi:hypothetical protein
MPGGARIDGSAAGFSGVRHQHNLDNVPGVVGLVGAQDLSALGRAIIQACGGLRKVKVGGIPGGRW